jgi:hypothetical protein
MGNGFVNTTPLVVQSPEWRIAAFNGVLIDNTQLS